MSFAAQQPKRYTLADLWRVTDARGSHYTGAESLSVVLIHSPLFSISAPLLMLGFVSERVNRWMEAACSAEELVTRKQLQSKRAAASATALPKIQKRLFKAGHFATTSLLGVLFGTIVLATCTWNIGSTV